MFEKAKATVLRELAIQDIEPGVYCGEWLQTTGRELLESVSPINGSTIARVSQATVHDCESVMIKAAESYNEWSHIPAPRRGAIIKEIGIELEKYKEILGLLVTLEAGKTLSEGRGEIQEAIDIADFAVGLSRQLYGLTIASERAEHRMYEQWHPLGIVGVITSFNFPIAVWAWNAFIAAVIGNIVVWKPSSSTPLCATATMHIANKVIKRHNLKPIFYLVTGSGSVVGNAIANDRRIPLVSFTGSTQTGGAIGEIVARRFGKSILELGGNNAAIVTKNADIPMALKGVAFGALATSGQRCTSTRRLIVHKDIHDAFIKNLAHMYETVEVGNPLNPKTLVGPLIDKKAVGEFESAITKAREEGGEIIAGGNRIAPEGCGGGFFVKPTIIHARRGLPVMHTETFAPILYVVRYTDLPEALEIHNEVPQGLSSAIFSNSVQEVEYFLSHRGSDCGIANVNTGTAGAEIGGAFGGEKETGGGRESGSDAWKSYARRQTVTINYGSSLPLAQGVAFDV